MNRVTRDHFGFHDIGVELTRVERRALARASEIAEQARMLCREIAGGEAPWEGDDMDMVLAHVEHDAHDLAEDGFIVVLHERKPMPSMANFLDTARRDLAGGGS